MSVDNAIGAFVSAFIRLRREWTSHFFSSLLTALLLLFAYVCITGVHEGSLLQGFSATFLETRDAREQRDTDRYAERMREELVRVQVGEKLIGEILTGLVRATPHAARARLAIIHNGTTGITGLSFLRFDVTQAASAPGRAVGDFVQNQPLSDWNDYLDSLLQGKCRFLKLEQLKAVGAQERLHLNGISAFAVCPVIDAHGAILGGLFMSWDVGDEQPTDPTETFARMRGATQQIAAAYALRTHETP